MTLVIAKYKSSWLNMSSWLIMTLNCELCQSDFSDLSGRLIIKLSKIGFLCTYVDQMIIQLRLMFCSKFSFRIFLLMLFPLFSKFFTCILKIYELPKMDNSKILPNTCLNNNHSPGQFYVASPSDFWTIALLTLQKMCPWKKRTLLELY